MSRVKLPPYAVRFGEFVLPKPIGGHPALELCNTYAGWGEPPLPRGEWLRDYPTLLAWAEFTGLIESAAPRPGGEEVLASVREFRGSLYRLLRHGDETAFPAVAERADRANALTTLTAEPGGGARFRLPPSDDPELPLHAVALAAADLLASGARVRACPGSGCGWLFLDPRGRRVWCSMASCGNRSKVKAHADRQRSGG